MKKVLNFAGLFILVISTIFAVQIATINPSIANPDATATTTPASFDLSKAFFLGLIQGVTEFLPISSTAHLKVIPVVLGWGDPGSATTAIIQLGSIVAVLWYFRNDIIEISTGMVKAVKTRDYQSFDFRLALGIFLGTLPIIIGGLYLKIFVPDYDNSILRSLGAIAAASIFMSLLLALAETVGTNKRLFEQLKVTDGIAMGIAQALALIPGVSRSGSTMTAGLFMNLQRATAARFSFLLGIPSITLAGLVELKDVLQEGVASDQLLYLAVGTLSALVFSYLSIAWLLRYLQTQNTWIFVWYRLIFGLSLIGGITLGNLQN